MLHSSQKANKHLKTVVYPRQRCAKASNKRTPMPCAVRQESKHASQRLFAFSNAYVQHFQLSTLHHEEASSITPKPSSTATWLATVISKPLSESFQITSPDCETELAELAEVLQAMPSPVASAAKSSTYSRPTVSWPRSAQQRCVAAAA